MSDFWFFAENVVANARPRRRRRGRHELKGLHMTRHHPPPPCSPGLLRFCSDAVRRRGADLAEILRPAGWCGTEAFAATAAAGFHPGPARRPFRPTAGGCILGPGLRNAVYFEGDAASASKLSTTRATPGADAGAVRRSRRSLQASWRRSPDPSASCVANNRATASEAPPVGQVQPGDPTRMGVCRRTGRRARTLTTPNTSPCCSSRQRAALASARHVGAGARRRAARGQHSARRRATCGWTRSDGGSGQKGYCAAATRARAALLRPERGSASIAQLRRPRRRAAPRSGHGQRSGSWAERSSSTSATSSLDVRR